MSLNLKDLEDLGDKTLKLLLEKVKDKTITPSEVSSILRMLKEYQIEFDEEEEDSDARNILNELDQQEAYEEMGIPQEMRPN